MEVDATMNSVSSYLDIEDAYGCGELSEVEKAIEADAIEFNVDVADMDDETEATESVEDGHNIDDSIEEDEIIGEDTEHVGCSIGEDTEHVGCSSATNLEEVEEERTCRSTDATEVLPYVGMQFPDVKAAYTYYNEYARRRGFSVRIHRTNFSRKRESDGSRKVLSRRFVCYKEGFRNENRKGEKGRAVVRKTEVRVGCTAFMMLKTVWNGLVVERFQDDHNHPLVFPGHSFRLQSHQYLSDDVKMLLGNLQKAGLGHTQIFDVIVETLGGYQKLGVSERTLRNVMSRSSREMTKNDCPILLEYLASMQVKDPGFTYSIRVSEEGFVSGIFWADSKARADYQLFGDVVVFDTTYKKNRLRWPFGPFTGVNNHAQSILFGCGLIANETRESFEWLFKAWMIAMGARAPKSIITDECTGIRPAVGSVFPDTVHRFCSWHVAKHALEHLGRLWHKYPDFKSDWKQCIYHSWSEEVFLQRWETMIVKYNLHDNSWLNEKFTQRANWVPCLLRGTFFAGMSSTQRSEGMNSYFRSYFKGTMTLSRFVKQYERAVARRREKEADEDFNTFTKAPQLLSQHPIEEHAGNIYTRRAFEIFKKQFYGTLSLSVYEHSMEGPLRRFKVGPFKVPSEQRCLVVYNSSEQELHCSCHMFEFIGLLCKHVLKILQHVDCGDIPTKYIMHRWTKQSRNGMAFDYIPDAPPSSVPASSVWALTHANAKMMALASSSQHRCDIAMAKINGLTALLQSVGGTGDGLGVGASTIGTQGSTTEGLNDLHNKYKFPPPSVTRGRQKESRQKHPMEERSGVRRKNRCSNCGSTEHNKARCQSINSVVEAVEPASVDVDYSGV